ncbi:hypothetical protein [Arthrobacter sp. 92]|uniref:hypothetical protein n=1 Tax=Arthrobacter sp. 92 TaxID=3418175 RepID=UPI003D0068B4
MPKTASGRTESRPIAYSRMEALACAARPEANCTSIGRPGTPRRTAARRSAGAMELAAETESSNMPPGWTSWVT